MKIIKKPWGHEKILIKNRHYVIKILHVNPRKRLSRQYHKKKEETLMFMQGKIVKFKIKHIKPRQIHRIANKTSKGIDILEVSTPQLKDVVRISDDFGRIKK